MVLSQSRSGAIDGPLYHSEPIALTQLQRSTITTTTRPLYMLHIHLFAPLACVLSICLIVYLSDIRP